MSSALRALGIALVHPRAWLTSWLVITVAAVVVVWPAFVAGRTRLAVHPGSTFRYEPYLDADFGRLVPEATLQLGGAFVFALCFGAFLAGAVLTTVRGPVRFTFGTFLAAGARCLPRCLRALLLLLIPLLLLGWGISALDHELSARGQDLEPGRLIPFALWVRDCVYGGLFLLLVFIGKLALADLCAGDRRCALLAWLRAAAFACRHPMRVAAPAGVLAVLWLAGTHAAGHGVAHFLEVREDLLLGLVFGQAGIVWSQIVLVAALVCARDLRAKPLLPPVLP